MTFVDRTASTANNGRQSASSLARINALTQIAAARSYSSIPRWGGKVHAGHHSVDYRVQRTRSGARNGRAIAAAGDPKTRGLRGQSGAAITSLGATYEAAQRSQWRWRASACKKCSRLAKQSQVALPRAAVRHFRPAVEGGGVKESAHIGGGVRARAADSSWRRGDSLGSYGHGPNCSGLADCPPASHEYGSHAHMRSTTPPAITVEHDLVRTEAPMEGRAERPGPSRHVRFGPNLEKPTEDNRLFSPSAPTTPRGAHHVWHVFAIASATAAAFDSRARGGARPTGLPRPESRLPDPGARGTTDGSQAMTMGIAQIAVMSLRRS